LIKINNDKDFNVKKIDDKKFLDEMKKGRNKFSVKMMK
jgi:hypothetical protein